MPREKELYRVNLVQIRERFGDTMTLNMRQAAEYAGIDVRTLKKLDVFVKGTRIVSVSKLASALS